MDQNCNSTIIESEILNPLNDHAIQDIFYHPCKFLKQRLESSREKCAQCFFLKSIMQETTEEVKIYIKKQDLIADLKKNNENTFGTETFEKLCEVVCGFVRKFQIKVFSGTMSDPSIFKEADVTLTEVRMCNKQASKYILEVEKIFMTEFTSKGLSGLSFLQSCYCYGCIEVLILLNEILLLKEAEEDQTLFKYKADQLFKAMEMQFREKMYCALNVFKARS